MDSPKIPARVSRRAAIYWICVLALAVALGVWRPQFFLLGAWQMAPLVLLATWLAPWAMGRMR